VKYQNAATIGVALGVAISAGVSNSAAAWRTPAHRVLIGDAATCEMTKREIRRQRHLSMPVIKSVVSENGATFVVPW